MSRLYVGLENIALTNPQRATLVAALQQLGFNNTDPQPCNRNHRRVRLDNDAVIFEANFTDNDWTIANARQYLADVFGVDVSLITNNNSTQSYGGGTTLIVTLAYQAANRMRFALFGGANATYAQSQTEARGYLATNAAAWGDL